MRELLWSVFVCHPFVCPSTIAYTTYPLKLSGQFNENLKEAPFGDPLQNTARGRDWSTTTITKWPTYCFAFKNLWIYQCKFNETLQEASLHDSTKIQQSIKIGSEVVLISETPLYPQTYPICGKSLTFCPWKTVFLKLHCNVTLFLSCFRLMKKLPTWYICCWKLDPRKAYRHPF